MKYLQKIILTTLFILFLASCSNTRVYKVERGDSLSKIAKEKKVSVEELKEINNLKTDTLYPGQTIYLKSSKSSSSSSKGNYHTVQKGESLYRISLKYKVSVDDLKEINNLKTNVIHIGDKIYLGKMVSKLDSSHSSNYTTVLENKSKNSVLRTFNPPLKTMSVNSSYGYRDHPTLGRRILHTGVDLKASMNTPVYSPSSGVVTFAGWMNGYGKIIIINNGDNYETRFAHLNRILIKKGDKVKRGEVIAKTGQTGRVTGPHLHYEIRHNNKPFDPMTLYK